MKIQHCSDYGEMSRLCSDSIISDLRDDSDRLICAATGNSPTGVYEKLGRAYLKESKIFKKLSILKLDEWGGISSTDPNSCETFIRQKVLRPLHISKDRYISFESNPASFKKECERIQKEVENKGPIDICILGLGQNGHIGFNEPSDVLTTHCHVAKLSRHSLQHQMANGMHHKPTYGFTLGMADILRSKKVILLITGLNKKDIVNHLLSKRVTTQLPASFLWLHPQVECYIDLNTIQSAKTKSVQKSYSRAYPPNLWNPFKRLGLRLLK